MITRPWIWPLWMKERWWRLGEYIRDFLSDLIWDGLRKYEFRRAAGQHGVADRIEEEFEKLEQAIAKRLDWDVGA